MLKIFQFFSLLILYIAFYPFVLFSQLYYERGEASYYADKFHGRPTASGEIYNKNDFTAAHRTLPFGTKVKVTNLKNGKSVVVRVNDRGPVKKTRLIDLSRAAAEKIDLIHSGVALVEITTSENQPPTNIVTNGFYTENKIKANPKGYGIQIGSFNEESNAFNFAKTAFNKHNPVFVWVCDSKNGSRYKVIIYEFDAKKGAEQTKINIKKQYKDAFVVEYKGMHCK